MDATEVGIIGSGSFQNQRLVLRVVLGKATKRIVIKDPVKQHADVAFMRLLLKGVCLCDVQGAPDIPHPLA